MERKTEGQKFDFDPPMELKKSSEIPEISRGSQKISYDYKLAGMSIVSGIVTGIGFSVIVDVLTGNKVAGDLAGLPGTALGLLVVRGFYNHEHNLTWRDTWRAWTTW